MKFSKRTDWRTEPNELTALLNSLKEKGERVIDLTESNPTQCNFSYLNSDILNSFLNNNNLNYQPDPKGLLKTREIISKYYLEKISPQQIFLTASTSDSYQYIFRLLTNVNDIILTPQISYPLFDYLSVLNDIQLKKYSLRLDEVWRYDFKNLKSNNAKALLIVNPNNPTGNFVQKKERDELNHFLKKQGAALVADEVFYDYNWKNEREFQSFAGNDEVLTFTLSGASKVLGLPQMKLSWIAVSGPDELVRKASERLEIISDTYLSISTPIQNALPLWLEKKEAIQNEIKSRISKNRACLEKKFSSNKLIEAEGGWSSVLRANADSSDEDLALKLLEKEKVYVHPGYFFDFEAENFLVLSLLPEPKVFEEGIGRILKYG